jgi:hypothetical protein
LFHSPLYFFRSPSICLHLLPFERLLLLPFETATRLLLLLRSQRPALEPLYSQDAIHARFGHCCLQGFGLQWIYYLHFRCWDEVGGNAASSRTPVIEGQPFAEECVGDGARRCSGFMSFSCVCDGISFTSPRLLSCIMVRRVHQLVYSTRPFFDISLLRVPFLLE